MVRFPLRYVLGLMVALFLGAAEAQGDPLTVATWGGTYQTSQENAYGESFGAETGVELDWAEYRGGLGEIREQVESGDVDWDVVDVLGHDARAGCAEGLFVELPEDFFAPDVLADLVINRPNDCVAPNITWSWVISYDRRAFPDTQPETAADFFDTETYPGRRAIGAFPQSILEMALMADGVPAQEVYDVLGTEQGVDRAFEKLSAIAAELEFWSSGEEPVELLKAGDVALTTAYNGRVAAAELSGADEIGTIYDGQILDEEWFAIVRGTPREAVAREFLRHAAEPEQQAAQARWIPYGPMRATAIDIIAEGEPWFHTGEPVLPHMPSRADRVEGTLVLDPAFWAENGERLAGRFAEWRRQLGI